MIDYVKLSDELLAQRICNYEKEITRLLEDLEKHLSGSDSGNDTELRTRYDDLKERIRTEANDLNSKRNKRCRDSDIFMNYYFAIVEADTYGFACPLKSAAGKKMAEALEEARTRLFKNFSVREWAVHCGIR